jgi:hypothetical protein
MSRFIGIIEITAGATPVLDVIVDTTETNPESAVFACIKRSGFSADGDDVLNAIAKYLGAPAVS